MDTLQPEGSLTEDISTFTRDTTDVDLEVDLVTKRRHRQIVDGNLLSVDANHLAELIMDRADIHRNSLLTQSELEGQLRGTVYAPFLDWITSRGAGTFAGAVGVSQGPKILRSSSVGANRPTFSKKSHFKRFDNDQSGNMSIEELEAAVLLFHDHLRYERELAAQRTAAATRDRLDPSKMRSFRRPWDGRRPRRIAAHRPHLSPDLSWGSFICDSPSSCPYAVTQEDNLRATRTISTSPQLIVPDATGYSTALPGRHSPMYRGRTLAARSCIQANDLLAPAMATGWQSKVEWPSGSITVPVNAHGRCSLMIKSLASNLAPATGSTMGAGISFTIEVNPAVDTIGDVLKHIELAKGVPPSNSVLYRSDFGVSLKPNETLQDTGIFWQGRRGIMTRKNPDERYLWWKQKQTYS